MSRLIGYARVSTVKQIGGSSLDVQKEAIMRYCNAHEHTLIKIYEDRGLSAFKHRPQYEMAIKKLLTKEDIDGMVVNDLTRMGRSTRDLLNSINLIRKKEKVFISINDHIDISTKAGKLMLTMLSAIADYERDTIFERMQSGRIYARDVKHVKFGRPEKKIDWELVEMLRPDVSWTAIAKKVGISPPSLIARAKKKGVFIKWSKQ